MRKGLRKFVHVMSFGMDKFLPDAIVLAFILTFITFICGIAIAGASPMEMLLYWGDGFWGFLLFGMQMTLIITTGYILATAPIAKRALRRMCTIPKTSIQGVVFIALTSSVLGWFNWGLGLVAGGFIARAVAMNLRKVDFKLYVAVAYTCAVCCGSFGISGSEILLVNTPGYFMEDLLGLIPLSQTAFEPSLVIAEVLSFIILVPILAVLVHPDKAETPEMDSTILKRFIEQDSANEVAKSEKVNKKDMTVAERIDNSPITTILIAIGGLIYVGYWFATQGFNMTLNIMNFTLLMLGILLHGTPHNLLVAAEEGVRSAFGVVVQFPFYAGIQGMMASSGLVAIIANFFVSISTVGSYPYWCYIASAIINLFIPSSGGIFMVTGPALGQAALDLGMQANQFVISFTAGEVISNVIQPFWAIPLLGIAGLKMKDIMGYCILFFIVSTVIFFGTWAVMW